MWNLVFKVELDELQKARWAEHVVFVTCIVAFYCIFYCIRGVVSSTMVRAFVQGHFRQKNLKNRFERYGQKVNKSFKKL